MRQLIITSYSLFFMHITYSFIFIFARYSSLYFLWCLNKDRILIILLSYEKIYLFIRVVISRAIEVMTITIDYKY